MIIYISQEAECQESWTLAFDAGEWSDSHSDHFKPGETTLCIYWIWGCVGPGAGLDVVRIIEPRSSSPYPATLLNAMVQLIKWSYVETRATTA
jgi:hypothetical protein